MSQPFATPPPVPPSNPFAPPQTVNPVASQAPAGSLEDLVMSGHRFIVTPYVISVVFMTFRRSMGQAVVASVDNWPIGRTFSATLITLVGGWWGIPWGPIFSIGSLWHLWNGGRDMTEKVLISSMSPVDAARILKAAPKPVKPPAIWGVRALIVAFVALPVLLVVGVARTSSERPYRSPAPSSSSPARPHRLAHPPAQEQPADSQ